MPEILGMVLAAGVVFQLYRISRELGSISAKLDVLDDHEKRIRKLEGHDD